MSVKGSVDRPASGVGICLGNNESAGRRKTGRIRKGNQCILFLTQCIHSRQAFHRRHDAAKIGQPV